MPFAVAAAGVTAAAGIAGSAIQADATKSAQSSANAAQAAAEARARADLLPYNTAGMQATTGATDLLGLNGPDAATAARANFQTSPGYQFSMDQGLRAVDAGAAAKGMLRSGATLKAEQTFGTGLADQEFSNYYNRLFQLSTLGENAAAKTGANAVTTGQGIAGTDVSTGAALSSIYGNEAKGLSNTVNTLFSNPQFQNTVSGAFGGGGGSSYNPTASGYTAGGAGTGTLQSLGFYTPLG
jgi:hypothetical protein